MTVSVDLRFAVVILLKLLFWLLLILIMAIVILLLMYNMLVWLIQFRQIPWFLLLVLKLFIVNLIRVLIIVLRSNWVRSKHYRNAVSRPIFFPLLLVKFIRDIRTLVNMLQTRFIKHNFSHNYWIPVLWYLKLIIVSNDDLLRWW